MAPVWWPGYGPITNVGTEAIPGDAVPDTPIRASIVAFRESPGSANWDSEMPQIESMSLNTFSVKELHVKDSTNFLAVKDLAIQLE